MVQRKPPAPGPRDGSNGWLLNHPLKKVKTYCEFLEECAAHGFEATLCRLTGGGTAAEEGRAHHVHAHSEYQAEHAPPPPSARGKAASRRKGKGATGPAAK